MSSCCLLVRPKNLLKVKFEKILTRELNVSAMCPHFIKILMWYNLNVPICWLVISCVHVFTRELKLISLCLHYLYMKLTTIMAKKRGYISVCLFIVTKILRLSCLSSYPIHTMNILKPAFIYIVKIYDNTFYVLF